MSLMTGSVWQNSHSSMPKLSQSIKKVSQFTWCAMFEIYLEMSGRVSQRTAHHNELWYSMSRVSGQTRARCRQSHKTQFSGPDASQLRSTHYFPHLEVLMKSKVEVLQQCLVFQTVMFFLKFRETKVTKLLSWPDAPQLWSTHQFSTLEVGMKSKGDVCGNNVWFSNC